MTELQHSVSTYYAYIYMAGSIKDAKTIIRKYVDDIGLCVTIELVDYLYTRGEEEGFRVGFINYPRFPKENHVIREFAVNLANLLRDGLKQRSYSIVTPEETIWNSKTIEETSDGIFVEKKPLPEEVR